MGQKISRYAPRAKDGLIVIHRFITVVLAFPRPKGSFVVAVDAIVVHICVSALVGSWFRLILGQADEAGISSAPAAGAEILRSSAPADEAEGEAEISSAPEAEILRSSTAEGEAEISCAPEAEILRSFAPTDVAEILLSEIHRSSAAEGEAEISSAPEAEILRSSAAEGETEVLLSATQLDSATSATSYGQGADRTQQINLVVAMIGVLATFMSMVLALCSSYKDPSHIIRDLRFVVVSMLFTTIICLMVASKLRQLLVVGVVMSGADLLLTMALVYLVISE